MYAPFARRAPAWPLLLTLGVHLLLAWSWRGMQPAAPYLGPERVLELVPVLPPAPEQTRLRPAPLPVRAATADTPRAHAATAPAGTLRQAQPITPPAEAPATATDPFAISAPPAPVESASDSIAGRARRDAGSIDRELRKGKSSIPEEADTPWRRFTSTLEAAHKERGLAVASETYTAPDGQVIYRFFQGGRYRCRSGGSVGPKIGGAVGGGEVLFDVAGGAGRAGTVSCPKNVEWKRD